MSDSWPSGWGWMWSARHFRDAGIPAEDWSARRYPRTFLRVLFKTAKRKLLMRALGQSSLLREHIDASARNILWINLSAGSIGDSIMDLSGRVLLATPGRRIDLLTHARNADLYRHDPVFEQTFTDTAQAAARHRQHPYDMVIIDSFGTQGLRAKAAIAPDLPFVGMWGFVNGYEIHRTIFSFRRIAALIGASLPHSAQSAQSVHAVHTSHPMRPTLGASAWSLPEDVQTPPAGSIALVMGGEWAFRTYAHWPQVALALARRHPLVLVGSGNGVQAAEAVMQALNPTLNGAHADPMAGPNASGLPGPCLNLVGKLSLTQTAAVLSHCRAVVCADGGLWHIACALGLPSVAIFADTRLFDAQGRHVCRDTPELPVESLHHWASVSAIPPEDVLAAFSRLSERFFISDASASPVPAAVQGERS